jgi:UDP-N-acetylglucosamine--N-acetylmuramyl-(pentapeptide) pyrophosphoryl-undecaprenol N-acetylglucosamine transferase
MNIVIAAGGTGGHLYPAVALAREFLRQAPASRVLFVGTSRGLETKVLAHEGLELARITALPVMGRGIWKAAGALLALPAGLLQSIGILRARRADLVIGIGGYTSPPVLLAAVLLRTRRVILEPNAYPGMANKVLAPWVDRVFLSYRAAASYFRPEKVRVTGTPIRRAFLEGAGTRYEARGEGEAKERHEDIGSEAPRPSPLAPCRTLLIFGGSQGSHAINRAVVEALPHLHMLEAGWSVIHQTGEADHRMVGTAYRAAGLAEERAEVVPFLFDMPRALRSADLVVSRAGAVTLAELTAGGKPALLIPLPNAIHDHQMHNARVLEQAGAACVMRQQDLNGPALAQMIDSLATDAGRLRAMSERSRALARTDAAEAIVRECRILVGGTHDANQPAGAGTS